MYKEVGPTMLDAVAAVRSMGLPVYRPIPDRSLAGPCGFPDCASACASMIIDLLAVLATEFNRADVTSSSAWLTDLISLGAERSAAGIDHPTGSE